eukprot:2675722-Prymnesium_polylepis.1
MSVPATAGPHIVSCSSPQPAAYVTLLLPGSSRVVMIAEIMVWGYFGPPQPPGVPPPPNLPPPSIPSPSPPPP